MDLLKKIMYGIIAIKPQQAIGSLLAFVLVVYSSFHPSSFELLVYPSAKKMSCLLDHT